MVRTFGEVRIHVSGTSMVPAILPGDLIIVQRAAISEISVGTIVLYAREGRLFAHRVMEFSANAGQAVLVTRGDCLCYNDPMVLPEELLGKVVSVERRGRRVGVNSPTKVCAVALGRILRNSDLATRAFVKLNSVWGTLAYPAPASRPVKIAANCEGTIEAPPLSLHAEESKECKA